MIPFAGRLGWARETTYPQRGALMTQHGMVASTNSYTSRAGLEVLKAGGNAVDAIVAMASVHTVVEPGVGHLGGDSFMLVYDARSQRTSALNGSGAAPLAARREDFARSGGIPQHGPLAASIPGTVSCWAEAHERFGSLPFAELLRAASELAADGFVVSNRLAHHFERAAPVYRRFPGSRTQYLDSTGNPWQAGTILKQPWLAESLRTVGAEGRSAFYEGAMAHAIVDYWRSEGGLFSLEDFARHRTRVEEPIRGSYRGFEVLQQPLPSQGAVLLLMLAILEAATSDLNRLSTADAIHLMIEAKKLAFSAKQRLLGDPDFSQISIEDFISDEVASDLASHIRPDRVLPFMEEPGTIASDTDYMCAVDRDRNVVSYIHSLFPGCGVTVPGVGALFNSRMLGFSLEPGHPNVLEPGKRPLHTLNSWMLINDSGHPIVTGGITAGDLQVQFNMQIISNMVDRGMQLHQAFDAPRWGHRQADIIQIEDRGDGDLMAALEMRGHRLERQSSWGATGRGHAISIDYERGILVGYAESRDDGSWVLGY